MNRWTASRLLIGLLQMAWLSPVLTAQVGGDQLSTHIVSPAGWEIADDFATDSREEYFIEGECQWRKGTLRLRPSCRLERPIEADPTAKIELNLLEPADSFRVRFSFAGASDCYVDFRPLADDPTRLTITVIDDVKSAPVQVRRWTIADPRTRQWTIQYVWGLLEIVPEVAGRESGGNVTSYRAVVENGPSPVSSIIVESQDRPLELRELGFIHGKRPELTDRQRALLQRAKEIDANAPAGHVAGKIADADRRGDKNALLRLVKEASNLRRQAYGEDSVEYLLSLDATEFWYSEMGRYVEASAIAEAASTGLKQKLGSEHPHYARLRFNLGSLAQIVGDLARAESLMDEADAILRKALPADSRQLAGMNHNRAIVALQQNDPQKALRLMEECVRLARPVGTEMSMAHARYANSLNLLGDIYKLLGRLPEAEKVISEALALRMQLANGRPGTDYALSMTSLASMKVAGGNLEEARRLFIDAAAILSREVGAEHPWHFSGLVEHADAELRHGDVARATTLYQRAYDLQISLAERTLPGLSDAEALAWLRQNPHCLNRLLVAMRRQGSSAQGAYESVWRSKSMLSRMRLGRRLPSDPSVAQRDLFARVQRARQQLAATALAMTQSESNEAAGNLRSLIDEKESLERQLAAISDWTDRDLAIRNATIDQVRDKLPPNTSLIDFVRLSEPRFSGDPRPAEDGDVPNAQAGTYEAFVLRASSAGTTQPVAWVSLGDAGPIEAAVTAWRSSLINELEISPSPSPSPSPGPSTGQNQASRTAASDGARLRLRELVWEKIEPYLDGCETVILLPDGLLFRVPWSALPGRADDTLLLEEYRLATASYGQQLFGLLGQPPRTRQAADRLLVVGDVDYGVAETDDDSNSVSWQPLPATGAESSAVVTTWGSPGSLDKLTGRAATETELRRGLPRVRFAHLATHGFFEREGLVYGSDLRQQRAFEGQDANGALASVAARNPLLMSGLVLAGANSPTQPNNVSVRSVDDGILTAEELGGMNLSDLQLITLSACESGLGDVAAGEGVFGLQRAFHQAGVATVLASLWKVDDLATQVLMKRFYRNLWDRQMSKVDALREAQIWMLRHPQELEALGVKAAAVRGPVRPRLPAARQSAKPVDTHTHPFFWAAFQLSGDWR